MARSVTRFGVLVLVAASLMLVFGACGAFASLVIAQGGRSDYAIIIPKVAAESVNDAAKELQKDIALATGAKLPIVKEDQAGAGPFISLGSTSQARRAGLSCDGIPDGGFRILTREGNLYIIGLDTTAVDLDRKAGRPGRKGFHVQLHPEIPGPAYTKDGGFSHGTANGVYTFLENRLNVRWLMPGDLGRDVPQTSRFKIDSIDHSESPVFVYRVMTSLDSSRWRDHLKLGMSFRVNHEHSWSDIVPASMYKKHPDWFPMNAAGKRPPPTGRGYKLETTNPELVKYVAQHAIAALKAQPALNTFSLSPTDGGGWSQSPASKALYDQPAPGNSLTAPSLTPLILKFYRDVSKIVAREYPQGKLTGYFYSRYREPPKDWDKKLPDNFIPVFAGYGYRYGFFRKSARKENAKVLEAWAKAAPSKWSYYSAATWFRYQNGIIQPAATDNFNYLFHLLTKTHINGAFYYGSALWNQAALINYTAAKMLWNPNQDARDIQQEWLRRAYGPKAGAAMEQFYARMDSWYSDYYNHNDLANYHIRPALFKQVYGDHYSEMESLFLNAWKQPMTDTQKQRLSMIRDNLEVLQWRLRNAGYVPADIDSPLKISDQQVADMLGSKREFGWRQVGPPRITKTKVRLQDSSEEKKSDKNLKKSAAPNRDYLLLYPIRDGTVRLTASDVRPGLTFANYVLSEATGGYIQYSILYNGRVIEFPAKANTPYYIYIKAQGLDRYPEFAWKLTIADAAPVEASFDDGVVILHRPAKEAAVYVYAPDAMNLDCRADAAGAVVQTQSSAQAKTQAVQMNRQAAKAILDQWMTRHHARPLQNLSSDWRFTTDPNQVGAKQEWFRTDFEDGTWKRLSAEAYWQNQGFADYHGTAWYRKSFTIDNEETDLLATGTHLSLFFGAIDGDAVIYVNGVKVGEHKMADHVHGWETPVAVDVTSSLNSRRNTIAVEVTKKAFMSGIYRGVYLLAADGGK